MELMGFTVKAVHGLGNKVSSETQQIVHTTSKEEAKKNYMGSNASSTKVQK